MDEKKFRKTVKIKSAIAITIFVILCIAAIFVLVTGFDIPPKTQTNKDITIYTANGEKIAEYKGATNVITDSRGGYIDFICDGKNYKYINCFIEVKENLR